MPDHTSTTDPSKLYDQYFIDGEVRPNFDREFISLWDGWLGPENYYKLDLVTPSEWERFNRLIELIFQRHDVFVADMKTGACQKANSVEALIQSYDSSMEKESSAFTRMILPELRCVLTEDWDFTYILWHQERTAVEALSPLIEMAELFHFQ